MFVRSFDCQRFPNHISGSYSGTPITLGILFINLVRTCYGNVIRLLDWKWIYIVFYKIRILPFLIEEWLWICQRKDVFCNNVVRWLKEFVSTVVSIITMPVEHIVERQSMMLIDVIIYTGIQNSKRTLVYPYSFSPVVKLISGRRNPRSIPWILTICCVNGLAMIPCVGKI